MVLWPTGRISTIRNGHSLVFHYRIFLTTCRVPFFIYRAEKENERILYANQEMLQLTGCTDLDDFMHFTKHQFRNLVHPEDLTQVEESIWQQIESGMNGYNDYVKYRLAVKDGTYKTVLDYGRIVESEHYGSVFYVLVVDCEFIKTHYDD